MSEESLRKKTNKKIMQIVRAEAKANSEDCDENEGEFEEQFCAACFSKSERIAKAYKDKHSQSSFT